MKFFWFLLRISTFETFFQVLKLILISAKYYINKKSYN